MSTFRKNAKSIAQLQASAAKLTAKTYEADARYWKPTLDKAKNGFAVIRFLPASDGEDAPWIQYFDHFFKGPTGKYYVEKSLTTFNKEDPAAEANSKIWNAGEAGVKKIRDEGRKRRQNFVANVLVVNDPAVPENNGKVFLFKFGKKIFDKIMDKLQPSFEGEVGVNVFDFDEGCNFKLKIRGTENGPNYDASEFEAPSPVAKTDDAMEAIYKSQYSLQAEISDDKFKSYEELSNILKSVIGNTDDVFLRSHGSGVEEVALTAPAKELPVAQSNIPFDADDDEDTVAFFNKVVNKR